MTKSDLIRKIAAKCTITNTMAERVVNAILSTCQETLAIEKNCTLPGFCVLKVRKRKARSGRNPRSGETLTIPACNVVQFTMARKLKDALILRP